MSLYRSSRYEPAPRHTLVITFGRWAYYATTGFIAFCLLCSLTQFSFGIVRGLPPVQQRNKVMTERQCNAEFPLLYPQLKDNVRAWKEKGGIKFSDVEAAAKGHQDNWGYARMVIKNGQIFIREFNKGRESRVSALLHIIQQAVVSDPAGSSLPPIDLVLSTADKDGNTSPAAWVIDKLVSEPKSLGRWLLPDFGFAGWPEAGIASYEEFTALVDKEERDHPWNKKDNRAFWRGLANWYPVRQDLLAKTNWAADSRRKEIFDVRETSFHDVGDQFVPIVPIHEHCRRKYLLHSEGNSYSGRAKYLLSCQSVMIAHPLEWTQHFHPALNGDSTSSHQNMVQLPGPLFEGLEEEVRRLQSLDQGKAGRPGARNTPLRVADNARKTLRERYLTPAATMCYMRKALRAYASVQQMETWGTDPLDGRYGPHVISGPGGGVVPSGGAGKDLAKMGAKGDVEYGVWRLMGSVDWPPKPFN